MADHLPNIWLMQTQRNIPGLLQALRHENPDIRRRAATSLRIVGDESAVDDLRLRLDKESNPQVRAALIAALDHLSPRKIETDRLRLPVREPQTRVERLIEHLMSNRSEASIQAAHALGELDDKIAVPPLIAVFRNRSQPAPVRLAAAEALLKLNSAPAEATLLAALRSEKWVLRRNGAAILGQLQADWAIEPLGRALYDDNKAVAKTARAALRHIGTLEAERKIAVARQVARNKGDAVEPIRKKKETQQHSEELGQQATMPTRDPKMKKLLEDRARRAVDAVTKMDGDLSSPASPANDETQIIPRVKPTDKTPTSPPIDETQPVPSRTKPTERTTPAPAIDETQQVLPKKDEDSTQPAKPDSSKKTDKPDPDAAE